MLPMRRSSTTTIACFLLIVVETLLSASARISAILQCNLATLGFALRQFSENLTLRASHVATVRTSPATRQRR